jgi:hypothetical protein
MSSSNSKENYSHDSYIKYVNFLLEGTIRDPDSLEIGENISDTPEVKIIFDGYGDDGEDTNSESYAIYIHRDALKDGFEFPEHDSFHGISVSRKKEIIIWAWYDVSEDFWNITSLEELDWENCDLTKDDVMQILEGLGKKYGLDDED